MEKIKGFFYFIYIPIVQKRGLVIHLRAKTHQYWFSGLGVKYNMSYGISPLVTLHLREIIAYLRRWQEALLLAIL